ncbi:hypothetical protein ACHAXM_005639 [Skeletonema potamos]
MASSIASPPPSSGGLVAPHLLSATNNTLLDGHHHHHHQQPPWKSQAVNRSNELLSCARTALKIGQQQHRQRQQQQQQQQLQQQREASGLFHKLNINRQHDEDELPDWLVDINPAQLTLYQPPPSSSSFFHEQQQQQQRTSSDSTTSLLSDSQSLLSLLDTNLSQLHSLVRKRGHTNDPTQQINSLMTKFHEAAQEMKQVCELLRLAGTMPPPTTIDNNAELYGKQRSSVQRRKHYELRRSNTHYQSTNNSNNVSSSGYSGYAGYGGTNTAVVVGYGGSTTTTTTTTQAAGYGGRSVAASAAAVSTSTSAPSFATGIRQRKQQQQQSSLIQIDQGIDDDDKYSKDTDSSSTTLQQQIQERRQNRAAQSRLASARLAEKSIAELGVMFTKMSTLISQQGEVLERIEDDVEAAGADIDAGHDELVKVYGMTKGNRGLILKVFGILIFLIVFMKLY